MGVRVTQALATTPVGTCAPHTQHPTVLTVASPHTPVSYHSLKLTSASGLSSVYQGTVKPKCRL